MRLEAATIVARNHDLHVHSEHSDGWHAVQEVAGFALRWLDADRWCGLSDHSPFLPDVIRQCMLADAAPDELAAHILRTSPAGYPVVQTALDAGVGAYVRAAAEDRRRVRARHDAGLLIGLELEWCVEGPAVSPDVLETLDYVIAGYHGRALRTPADAEAFLRRVIRHPYTDVIAHPDRFLGSFDVRQCDWSALFAEMAACHVLCEYNLTTPLPDDVLALAFATPDLQFVIGSDIHDFRRRCHRRVVDAWAESDSGGFARARQFLDGFMPVTGEAGDAMRALYRSPAHLAALEGRLWERTRRVRPIDQSMSPGERDLLEQLDQPVSDARDRAFLVERLTRFTAILSSRIASLLPEEAFRHLVHRNRARRWERVGASLGPS